MDRKEFEKRYCNNFKVRAETTERGHIISGRPIVYESPTDMGYYKEIIARGALDGTDLTDVRLLVNHDIDMIPLAHSRRNNGNSTMKLTPDNEGLSMDHALLDTENNVTARALYSAVERGDLVGMSFMFTIDEEEWADLETDYPTRTITKIGKIIEISAVTFPAYSDTTISARNKNALENARKAVETAKQQRAGALDNAKEDSENDETELLKERLRLLTII